MIDALTTALSGIWLGQAQLEATAHNLANLHTEGFIRREVRGRELPDGGVTAEVLSAEAGSDLAADLVATLLARHTVALNAAVARRSGAVAGELMDLLA